MPDIPYHPPISDLFANFQHNWTTLSPVLSVLFGTIFATWLLLKVKKAFFGDDDD